MMYQRFTIGLLSFSRVHWISDPTIVQTRFAAACKSLSAVPLFTLPYSLIRGISPKQADRAEIAIEFFRANRHSPNLKD